MQCQAIEKAGVLQIFKEMEENKVGVIIDPEFAMNWIMKVGEGVVKEK